MTADVHDSGHGGGGGDRTSLADGDLVQLVHDLADALVVADPDGTIVLWNAAAADLFGWSASEAVGQPLELIIPERLRGRHDAGYRRVMETGRTEYAGRLLEVPALRRDGRPLSISFTVTLLRAPGEARPRGIAAVIRDETERWEERRRIRDELAAARAATGQGG